MTSRFDNAAKEWDKNERRRQTAERIFEAINSQVALGANMDIMDFGAGTGLLSFKIAPHVNSVTAVDLSEKMLEQLKAKNSTSLHIDTIAQDIMQSPLEKRFDGIVSSMAMHHIEETEKFFDTLYAHLEKGGFIAIADLYKEDGSFHTAGNEGVYHFGFDTKTLRRILEKTGFENIAFHNVHSIEKPHRSFDLFLLSAYKPA
jgi:cyclopropane fatty-acyl-phospholipid synthase-like methyltransferase